MKKIVFFILVISVLLYSCKQKNNTNTDKNKINKKEFNASILDSLVTSTKTSDDTIFLGFTLGMDKDAYYNHIKSLIKNGKTLEYSEEWTIKTGIGIYKKSGYAYKTSIVDYPSGKKFVGEGWYLLEPFFTDNNTLIQLNVYNVETWNDVTVQYNPNWFKNQVFDSSKDVNYPAFRKFLLEHDFITHSSYLRTHKDVAIYNYLYYTTFIDLKTFYTRCLDTIKEENTIKYDDKPLQKEF